MWPTKKYTNTGDHYSRTQPTPLGLATKDKIVENLKMIYQKEKHRYEDGALEILTSTERVVLGTRLSLLDQLSHIARAKLPRQTLRTCSASRQTHRLTACSALETNNASDIRKDPVAGKSRAVKHSHCKPRWQGSFASGGQAPGSGCARDVLNYSMFPCLNPQ